MPKLNSLTSGSAIIALCALTLAGCASQPERGDRRGGPQSDRGGSYQGGIIARPLAILLTSMDANGDYLVSGDELSDGLDKEWMNLTGGVSGPVSALDLGDWAKEVLGSAEAMPSSISFDRDLNGQITELEFLDRLRAEFRTLDKDDDGHVSRAEMVSRLPAPNIQGQQQGGRQGRGGGGGGRGEGPPRR